MKKILFLLTIAALPLSVASSANLPANGGYAGPYVHDEEPGYGYLDTDLVYDENVVTFERSSSGISVTSAGEIVESCRELLGEFDAGDLGTPCTYCLEVATTCEGYAACLEEAAPGGPLACSHKEWSDEGNICQLHGKFALGDAALSCPIGGNAALLLIFALPYGVICLYRKKKKHNNNV